MTTKEEILKTRDELNTLNETCVKAKATYDEIVSNMEKLQIELAELGFNPENVDEEISKLEEDITKRLDEVKGNIAKVRERIGGSV